MIETQQDLAFELLYITYYNVKNRMVVGALKKRSTTNNHDHDSKAAYKETTRNY